MIRAARLIAAPALALLLSLLLILALSAGSALAATQTKGGLSVTAPDEVAEGHPFLVDIRAAGAAKSVVVEWLGKRAEISLVREGGASRAQVLLGAGLGLAPGEHVVTVASDGGRDQVACAVRVAPGVFPEQRLTLPPKMVTPSKEDQARIKREQELVAQAVAVASPVRLWSLPLLRPVPGEVTSAFGLRRILNGQPRSSHSGLDLDGFKGEPVLAAGQGRVALVGDFYYNGKSVFLDHGNGVFSMYFHLSGIGVAEGQRVERGQEIGRVGATGRATGPHLHFGLKILGQNVDPTSLFEAGVTSGGGSKGGS
ncbi:M23 family metallopeptidase [Fundidesulfovibrio agrisoli]|uniref:M23 family metallopeptidase n=1 Tax=Fundidesulfovibrio agrisoli TaxID=2922717 RepID=UPI001FADEAAB|nr:M23 family metallopeptidase [Fundidesulfovibrio agrisoli]